MENIRHIIYANQPIDPDENQIVIEIEGQDPRIFVDKTLTITKIANLRCYLIPTVLASFAFLLICDNIPIHEPSKTITLFTLGAFFGASIILNMAICILCCKID